MSQVIHPKLVAEAKRVTTDLEKVIHHQIPLEEIKSQYETEKNIMFAQYARLHLIRTALASLRNHQELFQHLSHVKVIKTPKPSAGEHICFTAHLKLTRTRIKKSVRRQEPLQPLIMEVLGTKGLPLFIKVVKEYEGSMKFKNIEPLLYEQVINNLVLQQLTPHIMMFLSTGSSNLYHDLIQEKTLLKNTRQVLKAMNQKFKIDQAHRYNILVLECGSGVVLYDLFENLVQLKVSADQEPKVSLRLKAAQTYANLLSVFLTCLFQVFYTLHVMDLAQLTHYDLHFENIMLQNVSEKHQNQSQIYVLEDGQLYVVREAPYQAQIYDWDFGYCHQVEFPGNMSRNLYMCPKAGVCNQHIPEYDLHRVVQILLEESWVQGLPDTVVHWIQSTYSTHSTDPNLNPQLFADTCRQTGKCRPTDLCHLEQGTCQGAWTRKPGVFRALPEILKDLAYLLTEAGIGELKLDILEMFGLVHSKSHQNLQRLRMLDVPEGIKVFSNSWNQPWSFDPSFTPEYQPQSHWPGHVFAPTSDLLAQVKHQVSQRIHPVSFAFD